MTAKQTILVLCGGQSPEHEVSVLSATNVLAAIDRSKYDVALCYIKRDGSWWYYADFPNSLAVSLSEYLAEQIGLQVAIVPGSDRIPLVALQDPSQRFHVDCVFPVLHGNRGEDGTMQGLLELLDLPYVGANVLGSALCMEKHFAKTLLRAAGLPVADWITLTRASRKTLSYDLVRQKLGDIVFIKPAATGSSIGIQKAKNAAEYNNAVEQAFLYDHEIIVESFVPGREIECSVLGYENMQASSVGEIVAHHDFYSYEAKYLDPNGADVIVPAILPDELVTQLRSLAVKACEVLHCQSMARVDFFVAGEEIYINELNTIPGFTNISMYPKNWQVSGLSDTDLIEQLIEIALQRYQDQSRLLTEQVAPVSS